MENSTNKFLQDNNNNNNQNPSPRPQENPYPHNRFQEKPSPNSTTSSTSSTSNPNTPRTITRSEPNNPYPTTFVQADSSSFKQVVQMLTGSSETATRGNRPDPVKNPIPPIRTGPKKQQKLFERRNSNLKNFKISPLLDGLSARKSGPLPEILSPSILDFPSLALSPVTPLIPDPFNRSPCTRPGPRLDTAAEEEAISKKGFFLHPSPASTPREAEPPRLLPLFPVTSPRVTGSSSS